MKTRLPEIKRASDGKAEKSPLLTTSYDAISPGNPTTFANVYIVKTKVPVLNCAAYNRVSPSSLILTQLAPKTCKSGHNSDSRSSKVIDFYQNRTPLYDFLFVSYTLNREPISQRFWVTTANWTKFLLSTKWYLILTPSLGKGTLNTTTISAIVNLSDICTV